MTKTVYNPSTNARETSPIPLWVGTVSKSAASVSALKAITGLLHFRVHVEDYRGRTSVQQCYRCQKFGHKANYCSMRPRCAKCAEEHNTRDCPHPQPVIDSPKCANCGGAHQANAETCPTLVKFRKSQQPRPRPPGFAPTPAAFPPLASAAPLPTPPSASPIFTAESCADLKELLTFFSSPQFRRCLTKCSEILRLFAQQTTGLGKMMTLCNGVMDLLSLAELDG